MNLIEKYENYGFLDNVEENKNEEFILGINEFCPF